jgi:hypothetical protein
MTATTASRVGTDSGSSGWASGLAVFAACMLVMVGVFQFFEGLAAVINDKSYLVGPNYVYSIDTTTWGWIHLIWGVVMAIAGFGVFTGRLWARIVGIGVAVVSAFTQFLYIPYYPLWAILIIALNVACIWALAVYGHDDAMGY